MSTRTVLLVLVALLFAGATAFFVRDRMSVSRPEKVAEQVQAPPKVVKKVLVAKSDLPTGLLMKEEHLRWQSWPDEDIDAAYVIEEGSDITKYYGAVVKRGIAAGQPVTAAQVVKPGDRGFLAAVLKPGMRAVTVGVNEQTGVAGLIFPGDRVDILMSYVLAPPAGAPEGTPSRRAAETVLENVRVLALEQSLSAPQEGHGIKANVATLEVTPKQAEMLSVVNQIGTLSLSVRSLAAPEGELPVVAEDEGLALVARSVGPKPDGAVAAAAAGLDQAAADAVAPAEASDGLPSIWADNPDPDRGVTYTIDTDVSRLMSVGTIGKTKRKVLVSRGSSAENAEFE
jgi:pilus assembly protein CpaB